MKLAHFFIDHPRFAAVLNIFVVLFGLAAMTTLPVAQYPDIVPPTIQITTAYPGASGETIARTVATPLEQAINGVENMSYISSQSTGNGLLTITVIFKLGTDPNTALMLTRNRVQDTLSRLPQEVQLQGVQVKKTIQALLLGVLVYSPDGSRSAEYLSNYMLRVRDEIARVPGVADFWVLGERRYAMRIWIDPDKAAAYNISASEIMAALRAQNAQVSAGALNAPPVANSAAYQVNVEALGRLTKPEEFGDVIIKADNKGRVTRIRDVGRVELGSVDYGSKAYTDRHVSAPWWVIATPDANVVEVQRAVWDKMTELKKDFPPGVDYMRTYDPTNFVTYSIEEVILTIFIAIVLVVGVVYVFLQSWRATIIPVIAIPISLLGTFTVLAAFGMSVNNLSLFGFVLAVGIVVDDAIVVVENVERNMSLGMTPREAARRTMTEVSTALLAIALTLCAVFVPTAFLSGISGLFFKQFAITIAASTAISCFVSLTLSPALCAVMLKPHEHTHAKAHGIGAFIRQGFGKFNAGFEWLSDRYGRMTARLARAGMIVALAYVSLIGLTGLQMSRMSTGFIPDQDIGYLAVIVNLPPGSSLERTHKVVREVNEIALKTPGVSHTSATAGFDVTTSTVAPNVGTVFTSLPSLYGEHIKGVTAASMVQRLQERLSVIKDAYVIVVQPPAVQGLGAAGGFKLMLQDRDGLGPQALAKAANTLVAAANKDKSFGGVFTLYNAGSPSIYADIDRLKAEKIGLTTTDISSTLQLYLGSQYVNDFNYLGRTYQVLAQGDEAFRKTPGDIARLKVRNANGEMVPIGSVATFRDMTSPYRVPRHNLFPAAEVMGVAAPGVASGTAIKRMEELAREVLPPGIGFEWTDLAYQQQQHGTPTIAIFAAAALFVFLVLAAQYESWKTPLAIVLIVPMCLLASSSGLQLRNMPIDILAQIGFVVLLGLAAKNAILIVEFAKQRQDEDGANAEDAAVQSARNRLRPILMTSFAFIAGVAPLVVATGAGSEMRQSLGTAVFFGMLGVTIFGLLFTPAFYSMIHRVRNKPAVSGVMSRLGIGRSA
ncbi:multidrug efflux RND transporter permease subunit [Cupriavidus sp. TA19]|uniref:efflux RND transporter permease subunit n=1 Tax=unclassified Cupriavidus TaxID=2640874 RepID=UPI000E2EEC2C|nr:MULTISPECIES: multidrug efflux RND transporter permease subunit [unclassified Cupriavidus]BDB28763.1 multidrug efflux RND transporter permease subunit [Cupriavidus sp. P-10]GLC92865.1 multidrug efflux RND transporter permease subunit [Cupriavidus sp. TA19]